MENKKITCKEALKAYVALFSASFILLVLALVSKFFNCKELFLYVTIMSTLWCWSKTIDRFI